MRQPENEEGPRAKGAISTNRGQGGHHQNSSGHRQEPEHLGPSLLDHLDSLDDGRRLRDEGMASAIHASDSRWKVAAEDALATLARSGAEFTSDDLRDRVGVLASSSNALGALIAKAARRGEIARVGFVQSARPEAHGRYVSQWRGA